MLCRILSDRATRGAGLPGKVIRHARDALSRNRRAGCRRLAGSLPVFVARQITIALPRTFGDLRSLGSSKKVRGILLFYRPASGDDKMMAGTSRASQGGYVYYVLNRGNGRQPVFRKEAAYAAFVQILLEARDHVAPLAAAVQLL